MLWELTYQLMERLSLVATIAFIMSRTTIFQRLVNVKLTKKDKFILIIIFSLLAIIGTYTGISIQGALANSRVVGIMVAGLLGGPLLGLTVGSIAGIHRYFLGGFTAGACAIAAIVEGLLAGLINKFYQGKSIPWYYAMFAGLVGETVQMTIILLAAKPYDRAMDLVSVIGLPMILVNSIGIAVFMMIVNSVQEARQHIAAVQAEKVLNIASQTLPHLRLGLNKQSSEAVAKIIFMSARVSAVAITNKNEILAHVGLGEDHHIPGIFPLTRMTIDAMQTGEVQTAQTKAEIGCDHANCKLLSAVVVPLEQKNEIIGALKIYKDREYSITDLDLRLAKGLAELFSTQLELAELEKQANLAAKSEFKALQAQVNPHFLFNALNTIVSLVRTQPELARQLILKLANFFRHTLCQPDRLVTVKEELSFTECYLSIEKARFDEQLKYKIYVDENAEGYYIPACIIQPLVENSIKHGLKGKANGGQVEICVLNQGENLIISVTDDGVGISIEEQSKVLQYGYGKSNGIGMSIVHSRLGSLFGQGHGLKIKSEPGKGTFVSFVIPKLISRDGDAVCNL